MSEICFEKIMTEELLFYDSAFDQDCKNFCCTRNITFLPSKRNSNVCYELVSNEFVERPIKESQRVEAKGKIFDDSVLAKFEKHHVLFVHEKSEIVGVVHFCDYNRDPAFLSVYPLLLEFERKLRRLLTSHSLKNEDMLQFFEKQGEKYKYYRDRFQNFNIPTKQKGMSELEEFQMFDLKDLMALVNSNKLLKMPEAINDLRNTIMHAKNIVKNKNYEVANLIYDFESFQHFFNCVKLLKQKIDEITSITPMLPASSELIKLKNDGLIYNPRKIKLMSKLE